MELAHLALVFPVLHERGTRYQPSLWTAAFFEIYRAPSRRPPLAVVGGLDLIEPDVADAAVHHLLLRDLQLYPIPDHQPAKETYYRSKRDLL